MTVSYCLALVVPAIHLKETADPVYVEGTVTFPVLFNFVFIFFSSECQKCELSQVTEVDVAPHTQVPASNLK